MLPGDDQRRLEADNISGNTANSDEHAMAEAGLANRFGLGGSWCLLRIFHQFHADHQAKAADFANQRMSLLEFAELADGVVTDLHGVGKQIFLLKKLDVGDRGGTGDRIAAKGGEVIAGLIRIGDFRARSVGAKRETIRDAFGTDENVRHNAVIFDREHLSRAAEAGLHFIGDEENAVMIEDLLYFQEVIGRRHDDAAFAHNRLGDEGRDIVGSGELYDIIDGPGTLPGALLGIIRPIGAVNVRRRRKRNARGVGTALLLPRVIAGDAERSKAAAVKAGLQGDEFVLAGIEAGELERALDGLCAAIAKKGFRESLGGDLRQLFGEVGDGLRVINVRSAVNEFVHLLFRGSEDVGIAVAGVDDADAGEAVEVLAAGHVGDYGAGSVVDDDGHNGLHETRHDVIFVFLDGVCHDDAFRPKARSDFAARAKVERARKSQRLYPGDGDDVNMGRAAKLAR